NPCLHAAIPQVPYPLRVTGTRSLATFPTRNEPVDPVQSQRRQWSQEWLSTDEAHSCRHRSQGIRSSDQAILFDAHSHPHVGRPRKPRTQVAQAPCPLGKHLERMPMGTPHDRKDLSNVVLRYLAMEQIAHRIHEDHLGLL